MERRTMTVGFADLGHYTRMVEQLGDERAMEVLDDACRAAGDAVLAHGGEIRKYIGDGLLFTFADPRPAVRAARAIVAGFRFEEGELLVRYHVALATGPVLVREIGHPSLRVLDLMGATVNRAGKLMREAFRSETRVAFCPETSRHDIG